MHRQAAPKCALSLEGARLLYNEFSQPQRRELRFCLAIRGQTRREYPFSPNPVQMDRQSRMMNGLALKLRNSAREL